ncbi:MAG: transposase [Pedosphaera sp.]|nr:transposase [Pedosphaera sp.]
MSAEVINSAEKSLETSFPPGYKDFMLRFGEGDFSGYLRACLKRVHLTALAGCWMENKTHYASDLTDAEWDWIEPHVPKPKSGGRPLKHPRRKIMDALFYLVRAGCAWRLLPREFAPWSTVYGYFRQWTRSGLWVELNHLLRELLRIRSGRAPTPTAAILDSQSVKTGDQRGPRGVDAGKKINGRKRHGAGGHFGLDHPGAGHGGQRAGPGRSQAPADSGLGGVAPPASDLGRRQIWRGLVAGMDQKPVAPAASFTWQ